ncbi:MAG: acetyl-CoA carboxylase biotin carboxylase subunit [Candidatus Acidiferrales bacterium]
MGAKFRKLLIANRGEIAVRILRACRELDIRTVCVFSEADRASLHVRLADEAYAIGPAPSRESYLRIDRLMDVARRTGCDALHPGYGFLAENPELPRACAAYGITFVGPTAEAMARLGSKTAARQLAAAHNVPTVPGTLEPLETLEQAQHIAAETGYPVMLKAVAGGGGKGMRKVETAAELPAAWRDASSEALNSFGDQRLFLEKYLDCPRHIEIQIIGDHHGNMIYLGERECSVQRRHQKVIEEAPSAVVDAAMRQRMGEAAVRLAQAGGYTNAGTLEFLVSSEPASSEPPLSGHEERSFYFLEMNTRLQVEHPVTEMVTGLDIVQMQLTVAAGQPLPIKQGDVRLRGHAIECRIYAEDPDNNFFPSPGKIEARRMCAGPGIRVDDGVYPGWVVPTDYDPLLGKLIAWAETRDEAIARMQRALREYYVRGIKTNVAFFRRILAEPDFRAARIHTRWLDDLLAHSATATASAPLAAGPDLATDPALASEEHAVLLAAALWHATQNGAGKSPATASPAEPASRWRSAGRHELLDREPRG